MPLQATSGAASYDGFGGGVVAEPNYIESCFSTYLYTGNGSTQTITNSIDLAGKGGLVWLKDRSQAYDNGLFDTARGAGDRIISNSTAAANNSLNYISAFNTNGFSLGAPSISTNNSGDNYVSWTFRKQPKFFDVVTYTGTGSARTVAHNLGSIPGCIITKRIDNISNWAVQHRSLTANGGLYLNYTFGYGDDANLWNNTSPTSTQFTVGADNATNASGGTYVAYLFAHNAGGFGLTGTDNVISCGSVTLNSSGAGTVDLGYEPQWVLMKTSSSANDWIIFDTMRGFSVTGGSGYNTLNPNLSAAEFSGSSTYFQLTNTGFSINMNFAGWQNQSLIYIAIRRGPMKVPTSGTSVFYPNAVAQADSPDSSNVPFPPDLVNTFSRDGVDRFQSNQFNFVDRLRGLGTPNNTYTASGPALTSSSTIAESSTFPYVQLKADSKNITRGSGWNSASYGNWIYYFMRRAPSFFDEVCYTGTGATQTLTHNLQATPELVIIKSRSGAFNWAVLYPPAGYTAGDVNVFLNLNTTGANNGPSTLNGGTAYTSTTFTVSSSNLAGASGQTYVAYLFATCAGVSKVGSYTGTGATIQVNCGFTGGARFVLIKKTSGAGDWYVWDTARGIVSGNDPYLLLNSTAAEVTVSNDIGPYSAGFEIPAASFLNATGATYIFLAIA